MIVAYRIVGVSIGILALVLAWIWYGWGLSLILFLAFFGHNMTELAIEEQRKEDSRVIDLLFNRFRHRR